MTTRPLDEFFAGRPDSRAIFDVIAERVSAQGPSETYVASQISFGVNRKFAWFWLYNVTRKNPSGVPHLMLALDREVRDPNVREVVQIGENRWNHQIVIRTLDDARSDWLGELIGLAYQYGSA